MLKYTLIATDLDGTLLDDEKMISDRAKKAIAEYQQRGGIFTIATGRKEESAQRFAEQLHVKAPVVAFNGAKVIDFHKGKSLLERSLDSALAVEAYIALRTLQKDIVIYSDGKPLVSGVTPVISKYMHSIEMSLRTVDDIHELSKHIITKILIIDPAKEFDRIIQALTPILGSQLNAISSDDEYFELLPPGVSKGNGLAIIAESLGIPMSETVAIGDHFNDISMLLAAGLGVAVANAREEVRHAADYITTDNNHDGVAILLEKVLAGEPLS